MFGRKKKDVEAAEGNPSVRGRADVDDVSATEITDEFPALGTEERGPYDVLDLDGDPAEGRLDLGSVLVPVPEGGQIQVEMAPDGTPQAVHLVTQHGRITVAAYAAPKSPGQWREVTADLTESLRTDNAQVTVQGGPWGREIHAITPNADLRFIGIDGYRWMIRCVAAGPTGSAGSDSPLAGVAREVLRETVVRRGDEPHPVRTPLPVVLPQALADQLVAAQQQQVLAQQQAQAQQEQAQQQALAAQQQAATAAALAQQERDRTPPEQRPGGSGSAMQQIERN
ncbi:DUF3710 domain-containing protein [Rhodococcus sp. NPDC058505]|uniref:DUF3710 domain-containing protein n=1 Tax=unclassified Rhodococcus (in: high G+C Gram-positive bacteria) TaxID=192944 RepID=UPI003656732D